jgi:hypothetical protein
MAFNLADYEPVEERLSRFWIEYPDGRIETELIESSGNVFIVTSRIYRTELDAKAWASGLARESVTSSGVNSTSALENCETSAIGRALANAGYAAKGKRPSREEMASVLEAESVAAGTVITPVSMTVTHETGWSERAWNGILQADNPLRVVTSLADGVTQVNEALGAQSSASPLCDHGAMLEKSGTSKAGNPYFGYVCTNKASQCPAVWYDIDKASGKWRPRA